MLHLVQHPFSIANPKQLLKSARSVRAGKPAKNETTRILSQYLARAQTGAAFDILSSDADIVSAFAWRTAHLTLEVQQKRDQLKTAWNDLLVDFYRASKAHAQYMIVKNFHDVLAAEQKRAALPAETLAVLQNLFRLFALNTLVQEAAEFTSTGAATERQTALARTHTEQVLLKEIRPHAVRLVDAWDFDDWVLDSSLGRYDGKVYEDMFHRASELNPLNRVTVNPDPRSPLLFQKIDGKDPRAKL